VERDDPSEEAMSDAQTLPRLSAPTAAPQAEPDEGVAVMRGFIHAVLLALPLWALIAFGVSTIL
jgi:hypothetical protein